jgi:hypothetical protein
VYLRRGTSRTNRDGRSHELDRIQRHTCDTGAGTVVSQRTRLTAKQSSIVEALEPAEPPRHYQFERLDD